jgi:UDP-3-O-[3-hydroxymyristoyl] glucosamine N-acyltransferase
MSERGMTLADLADVAGARGNTASGSRGRGEPEENEEAPRVTRVSSIGAAETDCLVFAEGGAALQAAVRSRAGAIFAPQEVSGADAATDPRVLRVDEPRLAFARAARRLEAMRPVSAEPDVHLSADVHWTVEVGEGVQIGARSLIGAHVRIGEGSVIGRHVVIEDGVVLGKRVVVQSGAVLGSTGFGYVRDTSTGEYVLFPQQGTLVIEDDVEIGANTTIDRGALDETRIGRGTKIDNLVHIGHNCRIGRNVVIAAQAGISGSCVIEDGAVLAGQVGISDHCHIGPGVILGGQAGVYRGKTVKGPGEVFAGTPAEPLRDQMRAIARLRRLR